MVTFDSMEMGDFKPLQSSSSLQLSVDLYYNFGHEITFCFTDLPRITSSSIYFASSNPYYLSVRKLVLLFLPLLRSDFLYPCFDFQNRYDYHLARPGYWNGDWEVVDLDFEWIGSESLSFNPCYFDLDLERTLFEFTFKLH